MICKSCCHSTLQADNLHEHVYIHEITAFCEHKLSQIGQYRIFLVLNFCEFGQNSRNSRNVPARETFCSYSTTANNLHTLVHKIPFTFLISLKCYKP